MLLWVYGFNKIVLQEFMMVVWFDYDLIMLHWLCVDFIVIMVVIGLYNFIMIVLYSMILFRFIKIVIIV